jgi:hypothetical protein
MVDADDHLHSRVRGDGLGGRGGRPGLPPLRGPGGIPARRHRLHRRLLAAVVPAGSAGHLGRHRGHVDDGRAFLERSTTRYDLILFALRDYLTLVSGQSSLRLESFLFTEEAVALARAHLGPDGVFSMYNFYRERWLVDRLAGTLAQEYGHVPCVDGLDYGRELAVMTVGLTEGILAFVFGRSHLVRGVHA